MLDKRKFLKMQYLLCSMEENFVPYFLPIYRPAYFPRAVEVERSFGK